MEMTTEGWQWAVIVLLFVIAWMLTRISDDLRKHHRQILESMERNSSRNADY